MAGQQITGMIARKGAPTAGGGLVRRDDIEAVVRRCAERALPPGGRAVLVGRGKTGPADWQAAAAVGVHRVITAPAQDGEPIAELRHAAVVARDNVRCRRVVAVIGRAAR